jgi:P27 family predicted phage terminase small subunit
MAGRKPKPTQLKLLEGNPGKRPLPQNEPKPAPIAPDCPEWLCDDAKAEWARICPQLERLGLLTQVDMAAMVGYCESWAQYKKCLEFLHKHGEVYPIKNEDGSIKYLQQVPQVSIANKALGNIRAAASQIGLSPSDRGRIQVPGADNDNDEVMMFLNK